MRYPEHGNFISTWLCSHKLLRVITNNPQMLLALETIMSDKAIFTNLIKYNVQYLGNMGISNVQGSFTISPAAFPNPSDPRGHTRFTASRHCLLQSHWKVTGGRPGKSLKAQASLQAILSLVSYWLIIMVTQSMTSDYYSSHEANTTDWQI